MHLVVPMDEGQTIQYLIDHRPYQPDPGIERLFSLPQLYSRRLS